MNILNNNSNSIILRNIKIYGIDLEFKRPGKNKYNEDTGELVDIGIFKCLYHSSHNHEEMQNADSGKYANDKIEMLLTEYTDKLKIGDICKLNNSEYKISDIVNFNQTNNSPKSLSRLEIYRQSKNLLSYTRGG